MELLVIPLSFGFSKAEDIELDMAEDIENLRYQILNNSETEPEKLEHLIE